MFAVGVSPTDHLERKLKKTKEDTPQLTSSLRSMVRLKLQPPQMSESLLTYEIKWDIYSVSGI